MIADLSSDTRKLLAICRSQAMQGQVQESIRRLADYISDGISDIDKVAALMLQAEIYYLNGDQERALEVFKDGGFPQPNLLPYNLRLIVSDNYNVVSMANLESGSTMDFYRQFDFRKLSGVNLWDTESLIQANDAAAEGKHYDALPAYWRQVVNTYHLGCWRSHKWASAKFSKECLTLGWFPEATHHAIVALDTKLIDEIGNSLLYRQDKALIQTAIDKILNNANLLRHALVACVFFTKVSDVIPDEQVDSVLKYLLKICTEIQDKKDQTGMNKCAWSALSLLAVRLNHDQVNEIIRLASDSCYWKSTSFYRQYLVQAVMSCVAVLKEEELFHLSKLTLPLATDIKSDHDYIDVLNLLCHMAEQSLDVKEFLAKALYPSTNPYLGQVAKVFGKSPDAEELKTAVEKIAASILLQVQHLKKDDEPKAPSHYFCVTSENDGNKVVAYSVSTAHLDTVIRHRDLLESSEMNGLVSSILAMLKEPENLLSNKIYLLKALGNFGDKLSEQSAGLVFQTLEPLATGYFHVGQMGTMSASAKNPLNPFKFNDNSPEQVSGAALYALACIEKAQPGLFGTKLDSLFESTVIDDSPDIRRLAFAALRELPTVSDLAIVGILFGTRDSDPEAAELAFEAVESKGELLTIENWRQLILSLSESAKSPHKSLRLIAAITISNLASDAPKEISPKLKELTQKLKNDICFSVRQACQ